MNATMNFKENRNRMGTGNQDKKGRVEISDTHDGERGIKEFDTQRIY